MPRPGQPRGALGWLSCTPEQWEDEGVVWSHLQELCPLLPAWQGAWGEHGWREGAVGAHPVCRAVGCAWVVPETRQAGKGWGCGHLIVPFSPYAGWWERVLKLPKSALGHPPRRAGGRAGVYLQSHSPNPTPKSALGHPPGGLGGGLGHPQRSCHPPLLGLLRTLPC